MTGTLSAGSDDHSGRIISDVSKIALKRNLELLNTHMLFKTTITFEHEFS